MDNKAYLIRAAAVAALLWGSVAAVLFAGQRPAANGDADVSEHVAEFAPAK